jgi:molecular chaperone DnaK (HSP70)
MDPKYIIYDVKRLIGRKYNGTPETEEERTEMKDFNFFRDSLLYDVAEDSDGQIGIKIGNQSFKPEDVASDFMMKMLEKAFDDESDFILGTLVVTVPAHYTALMRIKTKLAGLMASKNSKRIQNIKTEF